MAFEPSKKLVARFALVARLGGLFAVAAGLWVRHSVALPARASSSARPTGWVKSVLCVGEGAPDRFARHARSIEGDKS